MFDTAINKMRKWTQAGANAKEKIKTSQQGRQRAKQIDRGRRTRHSDGAVSLTSRHNIVACARPVKVSGMLEQTVDHVKLPKQAVGTPGLPLARAEWSSVSPSTSRSLQPKRSPCHMSMGGFASRLHEEEEVCSVSWQQKRT